MKTNTKIILSFFGGAAVGSLICFALLKEKYEDIANEEIDSMNDYYEGELKNVREIIDEMKNDEEEEKKTYVDYVKKYSPDEIVKDKYYDTPYPDNIDEDYHEDEEPKEDPIENDLYYDTPFVISREDFDDTYEYFDKISLTYYEQDDVLADSQEEVIPDIDTVIGYEALSRFGDMSDDDNIVYVRNGRLASDYEVILAKESYVESVLGIVYDKPISPRRREFDE